jgi:mannose-6-phosphate isomerase-like protein (cupin superfamily)
MFLLLSFFLVAAPAFAQAPPDKPPQTGQPSAPAQPRPAQPRPTPRRSEASGRAGIALTVSDMSGATLSDVRVALSGAASAEKTTDGGGQTNFSGLQAGTYRLRFSGDGVATFEKEVTLRAGQILTQSITLTRVEAPPPPPPPPAPEPTKAPSAGPLGQPQLGSLTNLAERERNTKERHEILLSCSANTRNMLVVLTEEQPQRIYEMAEATYYVVGGQGSAKVGALQSVISPGSFIAIPRGTPFSLARQGNRPLVLLWTLSGEPCEQAR